MTHTMVYVIQLEPPENFLVMVIDDSKNLLKVTKTFLKRVLTLNVLLVYVQVKKDLQEQTMQYNQSLLKYMSV